MYIIPVLVSASLPLSADQQATFSRNFVLLLKYALFLSIYGLYTYREEVDLDLLIWFLLSSPRCPLLLSMDLIGIAKGFAQFHLLAFALGTLLLIPCASKKDQQVQVNMPSTSKGVFCC